MRWLWLIALLSGCFDPYYDEQIDALGPEASGFEPSETHRPGAPCLLCHSAYDGTEPHMTVAGTLFALGEGREPFMVEGFTVRLVDSEGQQHDMVSNRCGNFYATSSDFVPVYPMRAELYAPDPADPSKLLANRPMASRISREGSCGGCHSHPVSSFSPGVVFVIPPAGAELQPPAGCPPPNFAPQPSGQAE